MRDRVVQSALLNVVEPIFEIGFADDFVILCRTEAEVREALAEVQAWMTAAGLALHPEKTRIVDAALRGGFDFLGWTLNAAVAGRGRKASRGSKKRSGNKPGARTDAA